MAVGKNKRLTKGGKKGGKKKAGDPFLRKEWYDIKAPSMFTVRQCGKTLVSRTQGTKIATEELKGRVLEVNLADLNNDEDQASKKIRLCIEEVQGRSCLTDFHGMSLTRDKICSLIKKWQTLIEAHVDVKTTDGYVVRMFAIAFTKHQRGQVKVNCYAQSAQIRKIRKKMVEIMTQDRGTHLRCYAMATKAGLEIGPSTIFDARPSLVEPTVMHLGRILEEHSKVLQTNGQMELEVRLGVLRPFHAKSFQRVDLPCSSEALLIPKCKDFQYRFEPGLPPEIYAPLMKKLDALRKEQQMECSVTNEQTLDITYEVPNVQKHTGRSSLRVSHQKVLENEEKRWKVKGPAVLKNRFEVLDLFSGRSVPTKGPSIDLRVALSAEVAVKDMPRSNTHKLLLKREKHRRSYDFRAWRIDFTVVQSMHGDQLEKHLSYEVELELNAQILRKNLEAKMSNKPHQLWELLTDFLNAGRDLAVLASEPCPLPVPPSLPQLPPDEGRPAYQRELPGMPEPLIGHYLYRLAEGGWKHGKRKAEHAEQEASRVQLRELVKKLIPESIGKEMEKQCQGIFPLKDCLIRKVKILKKPKFDITKLMELHGEGGDDTGVEMMRPEADEAMNTLTADVAAAGDDE